jgi:hypothetical protein
MSCSADDDNDYIIIHKIYHIMCPLYDVKLTSHSHAVTCALITFVFR